MKSEVRWAVLVVSLMLTGCGDGPASLDGGSIPAIPAKGRVAGADGKLLTEGIITLEPLPEGGSTNQATGQIKPDGTFELRSGSNTPGAVPGKYRVLIEAGGVKKKAKPGEDVLVEVREGQDLDIKLP